MFRAERLKFLRDWYYKPRPPMVPDKEAIKAAKVIKAKFPAVRVFVCEEGFVIGLGVEINLDGELKRNGWAVEKTTDWQKAGEEALKWLTSHYHS